jgi:hypothetical protein
VRGLDSGGLQAHGFTLGDRLRTGNGALMMGLEFLALFLHVTFHFTDPNVHSGIVSLFVADDIVGHGALRRLEYFI